MDIKYHIETAWKHCIENVVPLIILTLVLAAVSIFSVGILAPVAFAGYTHSLFQLLKHLKNKCWNIPIGMKKLKY